MAPVYAYRLEPRSPFHFGERGVGVEETAETFRSDSLFSALCSVVREGWGTPRLEQLLEAFRDGSPPPFRLSSCFPYAGEVLFFPRPMLPLIAPPAPDAAKRLKALRFVSLAFFRRWLDGAEGDLDAPADDFLPESRAVVSTDERTSLAGLLGPAGTSAAPQPALWARADVPRVTVDRATSASAVYRCGRLVFRPGCGLFFLVEWRDESFRPLVEPALWVLGDAGIGGRRGTGHGQFRPLTAQLVDLPAPERPDALVTLSLYWPTAAELAAGVLAGVARYDLVSRYGWMSSPEGRAIRRREVRMVAEGSVLAPVADSLGALVDVTPAGFAAHRVFRHGLAFPIPVRRPEARDG